MALPSCPPMPISYFASHPFHAAADLYQELRQAGILVRHFALPRIENYLRITIGTDPDMDQLIETLQQILNSRPLEIAAG